METIRAPTLAIDHDHRLTTTAFAKRWKSFGHFRCMLHSHERKMTGFSKLRNHLLGHGFIHS